MAKFKIIIIAGIFIILYGLGYAIGMYLYDRCKQSVDPSVDSPIYLNGTAPSDGDSIHIIDPIYIKKEKTIK
jgi:hypothetical protein